MDLCFRCHQKGHWIRDCPFKTPTKSKPYAATPSSFPHAYDVPLFPCPCGYGTCLVNVSHSERNSGRFYYSCPGVNGSKCSTFIKWCDQVRPDETCRTTQPLYPICSCGAGITRRSTLTYGPNAGRNYFVCPIKKGHGACPFFQWEDTQGNTTVNNHVEVNKCKGNEEESSSEHPKRTRLDSPAQTTYTHHSPAYGTEFSSLEKTPDCRQRGLYDEELDKSTSADYFDAPQVVTIESLQYDQDSDSGDPMNKGVLQVCRLGSQVEIHRQQKEFWRQVSSTGGDSSVRDPVHQFSALLISDWWGRLAFPPSRCLTNPPPRPFFCCYFPSFDPIIVPKDMSVAHARRDPLQSLCGDLKSLSSLLPTTVTTKLIFDFLRLGALSSQSQLVTPYYESKRQLGGRALECIDSISNYDRTEAEHSTSNDRHMQELTERYQNENVKFEHISGLHAESMEALTASEEYLQLLYKEASHVKEMLAKIEKQVECFESKRSELKDRALEYSEKKVESWKSLQAAAQQLEAAMKS